MKIQQFLLAAAWAAIVGPAAAQSHLALYGVVDLGLVSEHGGANGALTKITSGIGSVSRFGLKGAR